MEFKMKGFPKKKGTKGFYYIPQSMQDKGFQDDGTYDSDFEYDRLGRPINDPNEALNVSKDIMEKRNPGYESTKINPGETTNVFGSLTTSVVSGKNKGDKFANLSEQQHEELFNDAVKWFKSREKQFGVGNVDRGSMANSRFYDYLANYGGPESAGGSWLQQRMIDSAYGRVDNEPHIPKDKRMYEEGEWTADKSPSLRTIRKNIADQYLHIMNNTANPNYVGGYSDSTDLISKRDAMKLARTLAQTKSLTRYPDPIRDNQSTLTAEEEEIEAKKIDEQTEKDAKKLDETQPVNIQEGDGDKKIDDDKEGDSDKKEEEKFDPMDMNKDGYVDRFDRKEYEKMMAQKNQSQGGNEGSAGQGDEGQGGDEGGGGQGEGDGNANVDNNQPVEVSSKGGNPYEYGTDEYYDFKKQERSRKLGLTKRIFNIYDNK